MMTETRKHVLTLKLSKQVSDLLTTEMQRQQRTDFRNFVAEYLSEQFNKLGGLVQSCSVSSERSRVTWVQSEEEAGPLAGSSLCSNRGSLLRLPCCWSCF